MGPPADHRMFNQGTIIAVTKAAITTMTAMHQGQARRVCVGSSVLVSLCQPLAVLLIRLCHRTICL